MAFKKDFLWGVATAATQIEGAYNLDGKTESIWDNVGDKIFHNENDHVACDHYHRYKSDVKLMKKMGVKSYRFSIAWTRIIPKENGKINKKGVNFYRKLLNELVKANITPMVTLYHWDLPVWVYKKGGWENAEIINYFADYVKACVDNFSDIVKYWMTINEPQCCIAGGYSSGWAAPFKKLNEKEFQNVTKNVMLAHGKACKVIRKYAKQKPLISFVPTASVFVPSGDGTVSLEKAKECTFDINYGQGINSAWWSDPIVLGVAPKGMEFLTKEDLKEICQPLDFYSFNIYTYQNASFKELWGDKMYEGIPRNSLGWEYIPESIYYACKFFSERYKLPIMVTENGTSNLDMKYPDGKVHDPQRIEYLREYLLALKKATDEGVDVIGYQYWSLMDNFEWCSGYWPRFGLVYVDYLTQERTLKDSAYYYKKIISSNGEILK